MCLRYTRYKSLVRSLKLAALITSCALGIPALTHAQASPQLTLKAVLHPKESEVEIAWSNVGSAPCLLNVGGIIGDTMFYGMRLSVSKDGVQKETAAYIANGGVIEGRPDPWVVFMPVGSTYSIKIGLRHIMLRATQPLSEWRHWRLTIRFVGRPARDYAPGGKLIPFAMSQNGPTSFKACMGALSTEVKSN